MVVIKSADDVKHPAPIWLSYVGQDTQPLEGKSFKEILTEILLDCAFRQMLQATFYHLAHYFITSRQPSSPWCQPDIIVIWSPYNVSGHISHIFYSNEATFATRYIIPVPVHIFIKFATIRNCICSFSYRYGITILHNSWLMLIDLNLGGTANWIHSLHT